MVLIEGLKGGKSRITIEKPLVVYKEQNEYTDEIYRIYGYDEWVSENTVIKTVTMYSRNLLNEAFWDRFSIYNDIFAVRTWYVRRENGSSISEI